MGDLPGDFASLAGISVRVQDAPLEVIQNLLTSAIIHEHLLCLAMELIWGDKWSSLLYGGEQERYGAVKTSLHTLMAHSHRKRATAFSFSTKLNKNKPI